MVANPKPRRATYADVVAAPENMVAEILKDAALVPPFEAVPFKLARWWA